MDDAVDMAARSWLFVLGDRPDRFDKARASGADRVIVDLEDAVRPAHKEAAREAVAAYLAPGRPVYVRVNGAATPWHDADLEAVCRPGLAGVVLPKAEDAATIRHVADRLRGAGLPGATVAPLVESARGVWRARRLAAADPLVERLLFGALDLALDLGASVGPDEAELLLARQAVVLASRVAGVAPPIDGIAERIDDEEGLRAACERARRLGFGGKLAIHPRQVAAINGAFTPTPAEVAWARRVVAAYDAAPGGAARVDGRMVDRPVVERARRVLRARPADGESASP